MLRNNNRQAMDFEDYRLSHSSKGYGRRYKNTYSRGFYKAQWEKIERSLLEKFVKSHRPSFDRCLDFACGTGRVTTALANWIPTVIGVDVSEEMLSVAEVPSNVQLRNIDITQHPLEERFDLITAFRFFLNAQSSLRKETLVALREHMAPGGSLVSNIHMSASSPMGIFYRGLERFANINVHNTMFLNTFIDLLEEHNFIVTKVVHYSFLPRPGRFLPSIMEQLVYPAEKVARSLRVPSQLAQCYLVEARAS